MSDQEVSVERATARLRGILGKKQNGKRIAKDWAEHKAKERLLEEMRGSARGAR